MSRYSLPIGPLWHIFSRDTIAVDKEVRRLLERLLSTPRGTLLCQPSFGVEKPAEHHGKRMADLMKKQVEEMYGGFLRTHGYRLTVEKIDDPIKLILFGADVKGEFFWLKIASDDAAFWIFWNYKLERWQLRMM